MSQETSKDLDIPDDLLDFFEDQRRLTWSYHPRDWAFPICFRVAVYSFATYCFAQFLCFSVTYRGKGRG